jgi:HSP20 family molecular chaperone IbpA
MHLEIFPLSKVVDEKYSAIFNDGILNIKLWAMLF